MPALARTDRGGEWWVDFRYRGRRVRRRSPVQTRRGAEQFERTLRAEFGDDEAVGRDPFTGPPPTLAEFVPRWTRDYVIPNNRPSTVREKRYSLSGHILPALGAHRLDRITTVEIDAFSSAKLRSGLGPKYVKNLLSVLRCCLTTATDWGLLTSVPKVRWPKVPQPEFRFLSPEESIRVCAEMPTPFWQAFVALLVTTGLRFGEAAALGWEDVVLDGPFPHARIRRAVERNVLGETKTGRGRVVPLPPSTVQHLRLLPTDSEFIFRRAEGPFMRPEDTSYVLHRACERAGVHRIGWHGLRHTFATTLVARGVPLRIVQELLGHTTIQMTCRYAHAAPSTLREYAQ